MSNKTREDYVDKHMSAVAMGRATLNYASAPSILGDIIDVTANAAAATGIVDKPAVEGITGGGTGRQSNSGLVSSVGLADDILKSTVGGQFRKLPTLLPGANLPFIAPLVTGIQPERGS